MAIANFGNGHFAFFRLKHIAVKNFGLQQASPHKNIMK